MNILLLASHAVAEFDDVRMFSDMGYDVFAPGGYANPSKPGEAIRPGIPNAPYHPDFILYCEEVRRGRPDPGWMIDWAKAQVHPEIVRWADVIICHHFPEQWLVEQWDRIGHKRVIWRTCGQSDPRLEATMKPLRREGLQIVRYSPKERRFFESVGSFAGEDALIRFGKYPDDYGPWIGDDPVVGNVTQDMAKRGDACGLSFWLEATKGLPAKPAGQGSEELPGGIGKLSYPDMIEYLRRIRVYLYTGTQPASYTLGLIEAMLSGVPVVSVAPDKWMWAPGLFEGHEIAAIGRVTPDTARESLAHFLGDEEAAYDSGQIAREKAIDLFGIDTIAEQWREFLR